MRRLIHIKKMIAVLLMVYCSMGVMAQEQVEEPTVTTVDQYNTESENTYEKRYYDGDRIRELKGKPEFQYDKFDDPRLEGLREVSDREYFSDSSKRNNSMGEQGKSSQKNKAQSRKASSSKSQSSSSAPAAPGSFNWLLMLVLFAALVIILMIALKLKPGKLFSRKAAKEEKATQENTDDIHKMHFESELDKAIRLKNFRLALRIMYLETLKKMTDKNVIYWRQEKTNWDYVREVKDPQLRAPFTEITTAYDYAWYGEFAIDEPLFRMMQEKMNGFRKKLN